MALKGGIHKIIKFGVHKNDPKMRDLEDYLIIKFSVHKNARMVVEWRIGRLPDNQVLHSQE